MPTRAIESWYWLTVDPNDKPILLSLDGRGFHVLRYSAIPEETMTRLSFELVDPNTGEGASAEAVVDPKLVEDLTPTDRKDPQARRSSSGSILSRAKLVGSSERYRISAFDEIVTRNLQLIHGSQARNQPVPGVMKTALIKQRSGIALIDAFTDDPDTWTNPSSIILVLAKIGDFASACTL